MNIKFSFQRIEAAKIADLKAILKSVLLENNFEVIYIIHNDLTMQTENFSRMQYTCCVHGNN